MPIQRFFDSLGAGGILLVLMTSLVGFSLMGVSNYRRSLEVCRAAFYPDATTPLTYPGRLWYTWVAVIDFPSHYPGSCPSHPPLSVVNLPGLCLPLESQVLRPICEVQSRYHLPVHSIRPPWNLIHMRGSVHYSSLFFRRSRGLAQASRGIWSAFLFRR